MQSFNELREYIIANLEQDTGLTFNAKVNTAGKSTTKAIWLVEKPKDFSAIDNRYIVIKFNEINGGQTIRHFVLELQIHAKEIRDIVIIKDALVNMLDFYNRPCEIQRYKKLVFSNEGGIYFDDDKDLYVDSLYFECKLI